MDGKTGIGPPMVTMNHYLQRGGGHDPTGGSIRQTIVGIMGIPADEVACVWYTDSMRHQRWSNQVMNGFIICSPLLIAALGVENYVVVSRLPLYTKTPRT